MARLVAPTLACRTYLPESAVHRHDFHQVVFPLKGSMQIEVSGIEGSVDVSRAVAIPRHATHRFRSAADSRFLVLDLAVDQFDGDGDRHPDLSRFAASPFFTISTRLRHLIDYALCWCSESDAARISLEWTRLVIADAFAYGSQAGRTDPQALSRACTFIEAHLAEQIPVSQIARHAGVSERNLLSLFHDRRGTTPHAYLVERRIKRALALLRDTEDPISEIALRTGFTDQSAMTRCMRRLAGITPARFRKARPD